MYKIFVINPGSTSTKLSVFEDDKMVCDECVKHDTKELMAFPTINDQLEYRAKVINEFVVENNIDLSGLDAIVGRGGSSYPVKSGVYEVNERLLEDTRNAVGGINHPSNLGIQLGKLVQDQVGCRLFMVDPICVDELCDEARVTGIKGIERKAISHALNIKGTARVHCEKYGLNYNDINLIMCNIDGGISIAAHKKGRQIDCNNACGGDGPFTPTRIGSMGTLDIVRYLEQGHSIDDVKRLCCGAGGFVSLLGTNDGDEVQRMIAEGNEEAKVVWNAFLYNIVKRIGSMATVLEGKVDGIILTGRYVRFDELVKYIENHCGWIAPIYCYEGEVEQEAMAVGALDVLTGKREPLTY